MTKQFKIDFHTHILPGADDGSDSAETSASMLKRLEEQQVSTVVFTPHYYSNREPIDSFCERRQRACESLSSLAPTVNVDIRIGAEVYFSEYLFNNKDLTPLCINGTHTMLVELPFGKAIDNKIVAQLDRLAAEYLVTPVLAHIERYPSLYKSTNMLETLLDIGCVFQTNLSSLTTMFVGRKLISLAKSGYIGALGTDSHNLTTRPPDYISGYERLQKALSEDRLQAIQYSMAKLLNTL